MTYSEAQAISNDGYDDVLTKQVYDSVPLLKKIQSMKRTQSAGGGIYWTWPVRIKKLDKAQAVNPRADQTYINEETRTQIYVSPRYYTVQNVIPWDKLRENKGEAQKVDLVADATKELKEDMDDRLATDLYTANPNGFGIDPITTIIDSTASYGGLDYNDSDIETGAWNAQEDSSTTKLELYGGLYGTSAEQSLSSMTNAATFGAQKPNYHLTTRELKSLFESMLESQVVRQVSNSKLSSADAGFENVLFKGAPVVGDPYCTAGTWLGIDLSSLYLLYDPDYYFKATKWERVGPAQEYALKKNLCTVIQLKCIRRKTNFKFTALDCEQT